MIYSLLIYHYCRIIIRNLKFRLFQTKINKSVWSIKVLELNLTLISRGMVSWSSQITLLICIILVYINTKKMDISLIVNQSWFHWLKYPLICLSCWRLSFKEIILIKLIMLLKCGFKNLHFLSDKWLMFNLLKLSNHKLTKFYLHVYLLC